MNDETHRYHLLHSLRFLIAPEHECSYLENKEAATLFVDPQTEVDNEVYSILAELGFRRSGEHIYRPRCPQCNACISVRINVDDFSPSRSQRRNLKTNSDLILDYHDARLNDEHFALYKKYMAFRHPGSSMDDDIPEHYVRMMRASWCNTRLIEIRDKNKLLAVAINDMLTDGVSAVYTFFDPDESKRGLGIYAILQQIEIAKQTNKSFVYLGYWIEQCEKMAYKNNYSALEYFNGHRWLPTPP